MYLGDNMLRHGVSDLIESFQAGEYGAELPFSRCRTRKPSESLMSTTKAR